MECYFLFQNVGHTHTHMIWSSIGHLSDTCALDTRHSCHSTSQKKKKETRGAALSFRFRYIPNETASVAKTKLQCTNVRVLTNKKYKSLPRIILVFQSKRPRQDKLIELR